MKVRAATSLVLLIVASGTAGAAASRDGAHCTSDAQCASAFCDLARCAVPHGDYGRVCTVAPRGDDGLRDGKLDVCGAYVCTLARCRSCDSDDVCRDEYGAPACVASDVRPGRRCGRR